MYVKHRAPAPGAMTVPEWAIYHDLPQTSAGFQRVRQWLREQGDRVEVGYRSATRIDGQACRLPTYRVRCEQLSEGVPGASTSTAPASRPKAEPASATTTPTKSTSRRRPRSSPTSSTRRSTPQRRISTKKRSSRSKPPRRRSCTRSAPH